MTTILAAGNFPTAPLPLRLLQQASDQGTLICCDGAAAQALEAGLKPIAIVGDGDSLPDHIRRQYKDIVVTISEQDDNDLTKATRWAMAHLGASRSITYLGATGRREDHTLGNISLLMRYAAEFQLDVSMVTDHGTFRPQPAGTTVYSSFPGQQVSVFNYGCTDLTCHGLKWPTRPFTQAWQGTLNEALASEFSITAVGGWCLVYLCNRPKAD